MLLSEFRSLTEHLDGELELLCAGAPIGLLWHDEGAVVSIDDEALYELDEDAVVLYRDE